MGVNNAHSGPRWHGKYACHIIFVAKIVFSIAILVSLEPPVISFWKITLSWILLLSV